MRAADLRFTPSEAAEFLSQVMDLNLSLEEEVSALETRTEGWIAGLQLAALSMQGQQDVHGFIQGFAGDHRYIVDYLVEEVLKRQPESIRNFLLQTSILDRLNGSLCDAVTEQMGSKCEIGNCSGATSSSFRWTISGTGIAIIISLPMCFVCT
jgi:LuxR family maltose regulon positive regulatory protein